MNILTRTQQTKIKLPATQVYQLLDNQLTIFLRPWGSQDYNQKVIDEISHYLSSAQADIDVTSPFDFHENLTSLANKTRIALLLAHDYFYKSENATEFNVGFEATIFFQLKNELAWSSVGRFGLKKIQKEKVSTLYESGSDLDSETLLPVQLIGIEKEIEIQSGSLVFEKKLQLLLYSSFNGELNVTDTQRSQVKIETKDNDATYWYSLIKSD
ncbi:MAG: hypothetical protein H7328_13115 [Bdellovibrio sp.]|nr:hypothetical protein [Bdellovibrio sp.]